MPGLILLLVLAVAVGALSYVAWISIQSLLQARLLFQVRELWRGPGPDGRVALRGRVRLVSAVRLVDVGDVLWLRVKHQRYRRSGRNSRWVTEEEEREVARFSLSAGGRGVEVGDPPTEVQSPRRETRYDEPEGCLGRHESRLLLEWLPLQSSLTVVGRMETRNGSHRLVQDNKVGLLLSPRDPEIAGWVELAKGLGGLAVVTVFAGLGIWLYYARGF